MCSYCGEKVNETRDHVPSKIILDEPFPDNLPVVPCCLACNQDFSEDEVYFACSIESILRGTTKIEKLQRQKIISVFEKRPALQKRIENSFRFRDGRLYFEFEEDRFIKVITKLAKGHAKFENSQSQIDKPTSISFKPLSDMTEKEKVIFFASYELNKLPEVGSRGLQNVFIEGSNRVHSNWITVQGGIYSYTVIGEMGLLIVRIVVWNYLAIEVVWKD
jgi:hypothetical protein